MEYENHNGLYKSGKISIYNMDCMEALRQTPDKYYDLCVCDPPYGIGVGNLNFGNREFKNKTCDGKNLDDEIPSYEYFEELKRVSKEQIIWGANYFNCFLGNMGAIIWDKQNPMPTSSQCEIASYSKHQKVAYYKQTWTNYVNDKSTNHPTEKPVKLYEWLLTNYAKKGDRILDTHLGSGSSAIAAHNLGFDFVGMELDKDYYEVAVARFNKHKAQGSLFSAYEQVQRDEFSQADLL